MWSNVLWILLHAVLLTGGVHTVPEQDDVDPIINEDRRIIEMEAQSHNVDIGSSLTIRTTLDSFVTRQSCHVKTPDGVQYAIKEGFYLPGVKVIESANIECGLNIVILSEDMVGEWILIARVLIRGEPIERRLPFTIHVEEIVDPFSDLINATEGNSVHVRLKIPTDLYKTCKLRGPNGNETHYENDTIHFKSCGFIIHNAQQTDNGMWDIIYGNKIVYRAYIEINVIERRQLTGDNLTFTKDTQVSLEVGPEDAVYCKLEDPTGLVVFDGFGRCNIVLERVTTEHHGYWKMHVGLPGQIFVNKHSFLVTVRKAESKAVVLTRVLKKRPVVVLVCSVKSPDQGRACIFRNPKGKTFITSQGVGDDRYISQSSEVNYNGVHGYECSLSITKPTYDDLGLWRCAIQSDSIIYYGFLTVLCPWVMPFENQESVITRPILSSDKTSVVSVEGDTTTLSCSIQASIKYCYFRSQNGTMFNVTPTTSSAALEYVGNGFDAGECGIRLKNVQLNDSGRWSCHVGLVKTLGLEQRSEFQVTVQEAITARHYLDKKRDLLVEAAVHANKQLEYCRFVRIDGLGFNTDRVPAGYVDYSSLRNGICLLYIKEATALNLHPWTVVAKVKGQDLELSTLTRDNLLTSENRPDSRSTSLYVWITISVIAFTILLLGYLCGSKGKCGVDLYSCFRA